MSHAILSVDNVGKSYVEYKREWARVASWYGLGERRGSHETWVLRHISFDVSPGESIGLVGQNGAGKSTLLKLIAGTCDPSEGKVTCAVRISALLELGLGFNSELTGRQNCAHVAGLMGIGAEEMARVMPDIETFAEIGEYFDHPMRTYSSGMQMRVAFSVATCVRPDLLIVDEALAVGDAYFVHKCFQRIKSYREQGTSLLFVSHDPGAVQALCDRAILLESGRMIMDGRPSDVIDYYNALLGEKSPSAIRVSTSAAGAATESGDGSAQFVGLRLLNANGDQVEYITVGDHVFLEADVMVERDLDALVFGYMIRDRLGQAVYGTNTAHTEQQLLNIKAGTRLCFRARFKANLGVGSYSISVALTRAETHVAGNYQWKDLALVFTVSNGQNERFVGGTWLPPSITIEPTHAPERAYEA